MSSKDGDSQGYDRYIRTEWDTFDREPWRAEAALGAVAGMSISRVLDVGCGAGQELRPFVRDGTTLGVGVDIAPLAGEAGRVLFASHLPRSRVVFARAAAERLPFADGCFDAVVCRLALPYTDNALSLAEMTRVLRPGGALLLKFHHTRFYTNELAAALRAGDVRVALHACRVLVAGAVYHATGIQPRSWLTGRETFQTEWLLKRELQRRGLGFRRALADSVPAAPTLLFVRDGSRPDSPDATRG